jgi:hypothetical protein
MDNKKNAEFDRPIIAQLEGLTDGIRNNKYGVIVKRNAVRYARTSFFDPRII